MTKLITKNKLLIKLFLLLIIIFSIVISFSQTSYKGIPYVRNFLPKEYGYESQNFSITQNSKGIMYFGNLNGIMEYNGIGWNIIKVEGWPYLDIDEKGMIYVSSNNEFGFLTKDIYGKTEYSSISGKHHDINFKQISTIYTFGDEVLLKDNNKIFSWSPDSFKLILEIHTDTSNIDSLKTEKSISIFKVRKQIFIHSSDSGLYKYKNKKLKLLSNDDFLIDKTIVDILPYGRELLLFSKENGFLTYNSKEFTPVFSNLNKIIKKMKYSKGIMLSDESYAIGTNHGGIVFIDKKGNILNILNQETGINDAQVYDLFVDKENSLWASLGNGVCRIEYPSAFSYFNKNIGLKESVSSISEFKGKMYIGTNYGIYIIKDKTTDGISHFEKIKFIDEKCYKLYTYNDSLYAFTQQGIYNLSDKIPIKIYSEETTSAIQSKRDSSIFYFGCVSGLFAMKYKNKKWIGLGKLKNLDKKIITIAETDEGVVWLGTNYYGLYRVDFSKRFNRNAKVQQICKGENGLPKDFRWVDVYSSSNGILFSTSEGIYRYDEKSLLFYVDTLLGIDFENSDRWVFPIIEDKSKNLWFSSGNNDEFAKKTTLAVYNGKNKKYTLETKPFARFSDITVETIYVKDGIAWFGGDDGLIRFDSRKFSKYFNKYTCLITQVHNNDNTVNSYNTNYKIVNDQEYLPNDSLIPKLDYKNSSISFEFSTPAYKSENTFLYRFFLENFDKEWSNWYKTNTKEYSYLPSGDYIFHVMSKDLYGNYSNQAKYIFSVKTPLYLTKFAFVFYGLIIISFILMTIKWRSYNFAIEKSKLEQIIINRTEELLSEKEKSEELVMNMLPKQIADELKISGKASTKRYKQVSVLFSDIQGFTEITEQMDPRELIDELDKFFYYFDSLVEKHNIEKIKTIGDAYMCAGGLPVKNRTNPVEIILAAMGIQQYFAELKSESQTHLHKVWNLRIGIHTGPVIAGVIGHKKLSYDIWGDTVNTASRLESSGETGEINISETTYELVKDYFICEYRGKIPVKHKGSIDMYFVKGIIAHLSTDELKLKPNHDFYIQLALLRIEDLKEKVIEKLEKELPDKLYYHNVKHTIDVYTQVEIIGKAEGVTKEELLLLKTAALLHDAGFTINYDNHELFGIRIANEILPKYYYSQEQIEKINNLILSTRFPPKPTNKLEEIICDADLDYLGRKDFIPISRNLFMELYDKKIIKSIDDWNNTQVKFIKNHQYFTETAKKKRGVNKSIQLENLTQMKFLTSLFT